LKVALVTDTHFGYSNDSPVHNDIIEKFFNHVFFPELESRGIDTIFFCGDFVDMRTKISFPTLQRLKRSFINPIVENNYTCHGILGNHDVYYRSTNSISVKEIFDPYPQFNIFSEVGTVTLSDNTKIGMIPWINRSNEQTTFEFINQTDAKYAIAHLETQGAAMMHNIVCEHGYETNKFEKFTKVFTGHFHLRSIKDNIYYIGNIAHFNWGDYGDERGFAIWDTKTDEIEYINNPYSPFAKIYYDDINNDYTNLTKYESLDIANKIVKVVVVNKNNPYLFDRFIDKLESLEPYNVTIVDNDILSYRIGADGDEILEIDKEIVDVNAALNEYVEEMKLNKEQEKRVKNILYSLQKESVSLS